MYRVELKGLYLYSSLSFGAVPNVPCGVESCLLPEHTHQEHPVPNAPCGVERFAKACALLHKSLVPNAPCGVERSLSKSLMMRR